jgi:hypothetical protein
MTTYTGKIQLRRNTSGNFVSANPTLLVGEPAYETNGHQVKVGDGSLAYNSLEPGPFTVEAFIRLRTAYTLTSTTAAQKLFNASANGALTLPVGWYRFNSFFALTAMAATGSAFSLGGTAVFGPCLMYTTGNHATLGSAGAAFANSGVLAQSNVFPNPMHTVNAATSQSSFVTGAFQITTAGTVIPSISLVTAAAAIVSVGSFFECWSIGAATQLKTGNWS